MNPRYLFDYEPNGRLRWRVDRGYRKIKGLIAGSIHTTDAGYQCIHVVYGGKQYKNSHLVWQWHNGAIPDGMTIDHKDRNSLNDRIDNLRLATRTEQGRNRGKGKRSRDLPKGVYRHGKKFIVKVGIGRQQEYLGLKDTLEEAVAAYNDRARQLYGEFFVPSEINKQHA